MPRSATVTLEVIAAGGEIIERQTSARGEVAKFNTQKWKDGAYEIRLSTQTAWKQPQVRFLPWYKGDAIAAVRELLAAAETAKADVAGDTVRMLAAMAKDRLGGSLDKASPASWWRVQPTLMEFQELQLEAQGVKARARANGFFRLAYRDDADGSTQFCRAYLPDGYESDMAWPLILSLHGYNPDNPAYVDWWRSDQRHHPIAVTKPSIYVEPHGRGNAQYLGLGDRDVMRCLDEAKRQFSVDPDRVYLTGESMGGHGTWAVVTRHPDVFAAAAPVFGGWDFRVTNVGGPSLLPPPQTPMEAFALERSSSFANAESLLNVPLLIVHGDADRAVSVENSRHVVRMLQRWGYDIRYHEMPGWVHEDLGQQGTIADWLLTHRRVSEPKSVRLRTTDLSYAGAYWLRVDSMENPGEVIRVSADVLQPGLVRIDSTNAASLSLDLPASLRGDAEKLRVVWNGEAHELNARDSGAIELGAKAPASGLRKRAGLEGPLPAAIATPFAVVIGTTSPDPQMREAIQRAADSLARQWQSWQHTSLRVLKDTQVTADQEKAYSLLLIGGADANAVSRRLGRKLPFATSRAGITVDGRQWKVEDAVLQAIYPNPSATDRYVYVVAATSAAGMYFWKPQLVHFPRGHPLTAFDWIIQDGRRPPVGTVNPAIAFVAAGIFDTTWHVQDRWTVARDPKVAAGWTLRRAPPPGFTPSAGELAALAGRYELFPGLVVNFRVDGTALIAESPRGVVTLVSEGERVFVNHSSGDSVEFVRDAGGNISGIAVEDNGAVLWAKRLP